MYTAIDIVYPTMKHWSFNIIAIVHTFQREFQQEQQELGGGRMAYRFVNCIRNVCLTDPQYASLSISISISFQ